MFRFHRWRANLRVLEIEELKTVPFVPYSHPFIERLIGIIRREYLDRVLFWTRIAAYDNESRVHSALVCRTTWQPFNPNRRSAAVLLASSLRSMGSA
jgi:hypothetical protein